MQGPNTNTVTTEEALSKAGNSGLFQFLLFIFITYVEITWAAFGGGSALFLIAEPRWQCSPNSTLCNLTGTYGPGEKNYGYRCTIPRQEWTFVDEYTTFVTEFDLVCDKSIYGAVIITLVSTGSAVGVILIGTLSDWFGRRIAISISGLVVSSIFLYFRFSQSFWMVAVLMFFLGIGHYGALFTGLIYIVEFVGTKQRPLFVNVFWTSYGFGFVFFSGIAYLEREWKTVVLILGLCGLPGLALCWLVPESLRWLVVEEKEEQARKTLQLIAKINKKDLPHDITLPKYSKTKKKLPRDIRLLFRSDFAKYTPVIWFAYFANSLIFIGVYIIASSIGGSIYLNWFLSGITEIISACVGSLVHSRFKRKAATASCLLLASLSCIVAAIFMHYDDGSTGFLVGKIAVASVLLKFFTAISLNGLDLIIVEIYPTVIRNTAHGATASWGAISTMVTGFVTYLIRVHPFLPFGIMAGSAFIGGLLVLAILKETSNDPVPEIFPEEETEELNEMAKLIK